MDYKEKVIALLNSQELSKEQKEKLESIFPELAESEDERIRKEIIDFLELPHPQFVGKRDHEKWIAWLEKQDENNMGISEATKKKLEDNLNKALEKETPESLNKFLDGQGEQGSALSEDDQSNFNELGSFILETYRTEDASRLITWLESLKERVEPQLKQEWSEEEGKMLDEMCEFFDTQDIRTLKHYMDNYAEFIKSLKDRVLPQPKQEWSKEDEREFDYIIRCVENGDYIHKRHRDWLKSLRPQWKPNEEMLEALYRAIPKNVMEISEDEMLLDKLYQGLKYGRVLSEKQKIKVMKANEAPETYPMQFRDKIDEYLWKEHHILGGCCSSIESLKYSTAREVAEKLTDAFIEKATLWLTENASDYCILHNSYDTKELIEDFITAMKRE